VIAGILTARLCIHLDEDGICFVVVAVADHRDDAEDTRGADRVSIINALRTRLLDAVLVDIIAFSFNEMYGVIIGEFEHFR
jgi:hypothetical protein